MEGVLYYEVAESMQMLEQSRDVLAWVVARIPSDWHHRSPGGIVRGLPKDAWSIAMNIAHLALYEDKIANPILYDLSTRGDGTGAVQSTHMSWFWRDVLSLTEQPLEEIMERFFVTRSRQIQIVRTFDSIRFNAPATFLWGTGDGTQLESAGWVTAKTVQHTGEHTNSVFRVMLFAPR